MAHATKKDTKLRIQELFLRVSLILTSQANHAHFCSTKAVQHAKQCLLPTGFLSPLDPQGTFGFYSCTVVSISLPHMPASSSHHSFHSMRQEQDNPIVTNPLGLAGADELVYDALCCIVEVTKLGLPAHQGIGTCHSKAKFKT